MESDFLKDFYKNANLSDVDLDYIISKHHKKEIRKNDFIFKIGEVISNISIVESGIARSYLTNFANEEITTHFFCGNEIVVDEISFLEKNPS